MGNKLDKIAEVSAKTITVTMEDVEKINALPEEAKAEQVTTPEQVTQELIAEEAGKFNDPEEIACMMLKIYQPRFNANIDKLGKRALARVTKALMEFPLGKDYVHQTDLETQTFQIGQAINDAKMLLIVKTYNDNADKIEALAQETAKDAVMTTEFNSNEEQKEVTQDGR